MRTITACSGIRNCNFWFTGTPYKRLRGTPQNLRPRWPKVSAINVTAKTMHERLVLVSGRLLTLFLSACPWHTHSHHFTLLLILEILNLSWKGPPSIQSHAYETSFSLIKCFRPPATFFGTNTNSNKFSSRICTQNMKESEFLFLKGVHVAGGVDVPGLVTFKTGLKQMIFFEVAPFN